ncbi:hypothetical protein Metfor_2798 [Methanoregula formicica SMSP]|uniref:Uncharacterized protein n=2 Tax=Methanoregula formicica TaxID=882104 RepID=L0HJ30_METFS|nr:hypothetical protein Metfor_2798 [Methanoregula formicica SMSP]
MPVRISRFLSQNLFCTDEAIISQPPCRKRVLRISHPETTDTLFMAGEDLDQIWRDLFRWNGNRIAGGSSGLRNRGVICPARGCHGCTEPGCSYAVFIRRYWDHPQCD